MSLHIDGKIVERTSINDAVDTAALLLSYRVIVEHNCHFGLAQNCS